MRTRSVRLAALLPIVFFLNCPLLFADTQEQILDAYEYKNSYLSSFRVKFTATHEQFLPEEKRSEKTKIVTFYGKGTKRGRKQVIIGTTDGSVRENQWKMSDDRFVKRLIFSTRGEPALGELWVADTSSATSISKSTPLSWAGLAKVPWDGSLSTLPPLVTGVDLTLDVRLPDARVLDETETIQGRECYSVVWGSEHHIRRRSWLAKGMNFALVRTEVFDSGGNTVAIITCDDFTEVAPGFFVPYTVTTDSYDITDWATYTTELTADVARKNTYRISAIELNPEIPDEDFTFDFPGGVLVTDNTTGQTYVTDENRMVPNTMQRDLVAMRQQTAGDMQVFGKQALTLDVAAWVNGEPVTVETIRGKVVALAFWDSTHESSAEVIATLNALAKRHTDIVVIAFHSADGEQDALRELAKKENITFRIALDKPSFSSYPGAMFEKCNVTKPPSVYITDTDGIVKYQDLALAVVEEAVERVIAGE